MVGMFIAVFCYPAWRKRKIYKICSKKSFGLVGEESSSLKYLRFRLAVIEAAVNNFSDENKIGKGGFGAVYKGILPDGQEVAIKRLSKVSKQGELEFKSEVSLMAKLQHKNLVALLGFCMDNKEKILIYEYVSNKSVDYFLFGSEKERGLNWLERFKILRGIAQGLLYLHEHSRFKVIHRDLKLSNILLDINMNPKISDFGLARKIVMDQSQERTDRIMGTYGYMSPEYIKHGEFSEKSDIYSFGVIILEVISGKKSASSDELPLLFHAWKQWQDGTPLEILDPCLVRESYSEKEVIKCIQIGLLCVQANPSDRPTMANIVLYLSNSNAATELEYPREPAFFTRGRRREEPNMEVDSRSAQSSVNEMSESKFLPR